MEGLTSRHRKTEEMSSCGAPEWTQEAFARLLCCEAVGSVLASEFLEPQGGTFLELRSKFGWRGWPSLIFPLEALEMWAECQLEAFLLD